VPSTPRDLLPALSRQSLRPAYALVGDELFFRDRFRSALLTLLVPPELREFSVFEEDLVLSPLDDILDRARNSSLMAPVQVFFIRNARDLFARGGGEAAGKAKPKAGRGSQRKHGDFPDNLAAYVRDPNPGSVLVFIADHLHLPVNPRAISMEDRSRLERIQATVGVHCELLLCSRLPEQKSRSLVAELAGEQQVTVEDDAAELLVEMLGGDMGLVSSELGKLCIEVGSGGGITRTHVERSVQGARQRSAYDLARALAGRHRGRALEALQVLWENEGVAGCIPLVFQLSRAFKMALVLREKRVRDRNQLYAVLPEGLRPPAFAADDILDLSQRMSERQLIRGIDLLQRADVDLRSSPLSARLLFEQIIFDLTSAPERPSPWQQEAFAL